MTTANRKHCMEQLLRGKRVLIADDMEVGRQIVKDILTACGALVHVAESGRDALTILKIVGPAAYDFVLLDIYMPDMDGYKTAAAIRALPGKGWNRLPVFALTAQNLEETKAQALASGFDALLYKPLNTGYLFNKLRERGVLADAPADELPLPAENRPWLTLMYITNRPDVAVAAQQYGVDRVWVDLEVLGKQERQPGNTVKSDHCVEDIRRLRPLLNRSELLVRVNPWNPGSPEEIEAVIAAGADRIMLPMWRTPQEVQAFLNAVGGRTKNTLLLETKEAVACLDEVLALPGIDEIHIGLNDLHLSYGQDFMFQPLADGTVDALCAKLRAAGLPYGFGGIARLGHGMLKSEKVIMEHRRLGSTRAILSRSFCNANVCPDIHQIDALFKDNMKELYAYENYCLSADDRTLAANHAQVQTAVADIVASM